VVEEILSEHGLIEPRSNFYHGRPVLIRENEPQLRLFNGDIGLLLRDPRQGASYALFSSMQKDAAPPAAGAAPGARDRFRDDVHKSQGSEFRQVLFVLPEHEHTVCTRSCFIPGSRGRVIEWSSGGGSRRSGQRSSGGRCGRAGWGARS
jgi:exodeoxyribonuclease V alpha subunit